MPNVLERVLLLAVEDYSGLWEIFQEVKSTQPQLPDREIVEHARSILHELVSRGWVKLYSCRKQPCDYILVLPDLVGPTLLDSHNWQFPEPGGDAITIHCAATDEGEVAYWSLSNKRSGVNEE